jgi:hypothetical protein
MRKGVEVVKYSEYSLSFEVYVCLLECAADVRLEDILMMLKSKRIFKAPAWSFIDNI